MPNLDLGAVTELPARRVPTRSQQLLNTPLNTEYRRIFIGYVGGPPNNNDRLASLAQALWPTRR